MSKDPSSMTSSPQIISQSDNPNSMPGMGFPVIHPPMAQFIPLGMVPINSNVIQYCMELASNSTSGLHPAMIAPMFGPSAFSLPSMLLDQSGAKVDRDSFIGCHNGGNRFPTTQTQTKDQFSSNPVSGHSIARTSSSSNVPSIGVDEAPVMPMPSVFFLPFSPSGIPGYFPNYQTFNVVTTPKNNNEPKDCKPLVEQDIVPPSQSEERKDSDELDVARILANMHVPVLKQIQTSVIPSGSNKKESPCLTTQQDLHEVNYAFDQNVNSINRNSSLPTSAVCFSETLQNDHNLSAPSAPQHCIQKNDIFIEKASTDNCVVNEVDKKMNENDKEQEQKSKPEEKIRFEEIQDEKMENPSIMKLEVISEGESTITVPMQPMVSADQVQPAPNEVGQMHIPFSSSSISLQQSNENCKVEFLQELQSIKSEVMDVSSDQNPVLTELTVVSREDSTSFSLDVMTESLPSEQVTVEPEHEDKTSKQDSPEENKDHTVTVNDFNCEPIDEHSSSDENGQPKKNYKCNVCSQLFRSPLGLQKHIEFHTDDGKHYTCTICFMHFCNDSALQEHHEKHTKKRPHKCKFCPKAFRDPGSLQKHVRVHTGEKPYNCKDCPRSFAEYSSLRKHQRVHTGEQPYKCQYCLKAFSISGNLQRHILIHTGERPYKCNFCTKAFNNPSHLRRHVKNLHFKGDAAIDEAMLSHYGNPGSTKPAENEINGEETMKQEILSQNTSLGVSECVSQKSLELASRDVIIQAL